MTRGTPNTLAAMPGKGARLFCAAAATTCALLLAACGDDGDGTIPPEDGEKLIAQLQEIEDRAAAAECDAAQATASEFAATVDGLPQSVDAEVLRALDAASAQLETLANDPDQCREPETGTTDTTTDTSTNEATTSSTTSTTDETTDEEDEHEEETTSDEETGSGPPADTPGEGEPGGDDFEGGGSSGGIGAGG